MTFCHKEACVPHPQEHSDPAYSKQFVAITASKYMLLHNKCVWLCSCALYSLNSPLSHARSGALKNSWCLFGHVFSLPQRLNGWKNPETQYVIISECIVEPGALWRIMILMRSNKPLMHSGFLQGIKGLKNKYTRGVEFMVAKGLWRRPSGEEGLTCHRCEFVKRLSLYVTT